MPEVDRDLPSHSFSKTIVKFTGDFFKYSQGNAEIGWPPLGAWDRAG